jgi:hypothetical protein
LKAEYSRESENLDFGLANYSVAVQKMELNHRLSIAVFHCFLSWLPAAATGEVFGSEKRVFSAAPSCSFPR